MTQEDKKRLAEYLRKLSDKLQNDNNILWVQGALLGISEGLEIKVVGMKNKTSK